MKKIVQKEKVEFECDMCGEKFYNAIPVKVKFGYGSEDDGITLHFCTDECFYARISMVAEKYGY